jgi:hypothetical protein
MICGCHTAAEGKTLLDRHVGGRTVPATNMYGRAFPRLGISVSESPPPGHYLILPLACTARNWICHKTSNQVVFPHTALPPARMTHY